MSQTPAIAVLGCGYWGRNIVRNFAQLGALRLVCDPSPAGLEKAREIAPDVRTSKDLRDAISDPEIQGVAIATPAETHFPLAMQALRSGKDVFVEKPMTLTWQDGLKLAEAADELGRKLMVGHLLEYHPAVLKLREMIAAGELGNTCYIYSNRLNFGKIRTEENSLWSFAPHDIAVILRLVGESPIEVTCCGGNYITPNLADVTVSCLHFRTGIRAHIFVSWLNPFKEQKLVVMGTRKMAVFNDISKDEKLTLYNQRVDIENRQPILKNEGQQNVPLSAEEPLRRECQEFLDCIATRRTPLTDGRSGIQVLRVLQACQISLQLNGRPTMLTDI